MGLFFFLIDPDLQAPVSPKPGGGVAVIRFLRGIIPPAFFRPVFQVFKASVWKSMVQSPQACVKGLRHFVGEILEYDPWFTGLWRRISIKSFVPTI
ncbi:hypothetical protein CBD41_04250 [bacterium TMED181]|nr:hypothetical protein [Planctomycetota bacterium]OUW45239.1 MAG: hypothetical protein CBD41_04250 [bacterium TMED181]